MNVKKQSLDIEGMHCASCAQSVERALAALPGVSEAHVNLLANQALVQHDGSSTADQLIGAVRNAGFDAALPTEDARVVQLGVDGMTCAGCVANVERALRSVPGVQDAAVNLATGMAQATISIEVSEERLSEAVRAAGFDVRATTPDRTARGDEVVARDLEQLASARRKMRLAWLFALPIIGWMIPEMFFGVMWPSAPVFHAVMTLLAAPALFLAGGQTLRAGFRGLWKLSPNMDSLIALGASVAFGTGILAWLGTMGWFPRILDYAGVAAMIMAIHLTGRWIEARAQRGELLRPSTDCSLWGHAKRACFEMTRKLPFRSNS